jgi:thiol-disulfide isomerase/thioredoxin
MRNRIEQTFVRTLKYCYAFIPLTILLVAILPILFLLYSCGKVNNHFIKIEALDSAQKIVVYDWKWFRVESVLSFDSITTQCEKRLAIRWNDSIIKILPLDTGLFILRFLKSGIPFDSFSFISLKNPLFIQDWKMVNNGTVPIPLTSEQYKLWKRFYEYQLLDKKIPSFKSVNVFGDIITNNNFKGKITVLNFWTYGCQPCMAEIPYLNKLKTEFEKDSTVQFISFYTDKIKINPANKSLEFQSRAISLEESKNDIRFIPIDFTFTQIPNSKEINPLFNAFSFPTNMVIDRNGIIRQIFVGASINDNNKLITDLKNEIQYCKWRID